MFTLFCYYDLNQAIGWLHPQHLDQNLACMDSVSGHWERASTIHGAAVKDRYEKNAF